ncbi:nucleotidyl transferase AbiEii/AbiGii toxin family protein [Chryseobacterium polytrichastri]|uniref:Nucleotidyl transferase AbiEii toxin, Type IV TA system n=1 Tax=Chryseobacterium polytrichastri TaxID=1302687 RepID=A0A1M7K1C1_9FLAO|nr:nucleotidyl transferase AbiEii/AbiGii toxin family protein [Chryseobacterium polytrichastri]SHM59122.1 Nucleotidyl transferase AbiEii toxin, Type IV TA system [Chryseobacterium polytrichastri]
MLYKETVSPEMLELLQKLMKDENLKDFNLVGGTALSLRIGNRKSVDIDMFGPKDFDQQNMLKYLEDMYSAKKIRIFKNTVMSRINGVKVDIITHKYPLINPIEIQEGVRMVSNEDIGAMKLHAIFQNGTRIKDFVDMYFLLEHHSLKTYLQAYEKKYNGNPALAAYGLLHYQNIDMEDKVFIIKGKESDWNRMKERLKKAVFAPDHKFSQTQNQKKPLPPKNKGRGLK